MSEGPLDADVQFEFLGVWPYMPLMAAVNATKLPYAKMNGLGNEILVVDLRASGRVLQPAEVEHLARAPATAFEQLMAIHPGRPGGSAPLVRIYNNDGSEAGACGNGMRCVALYESGRTDSPACAFETKAGLLKADVRSAAEISVTMGKPRFG